MAVFYGVLAAIAFGTNDWSAMRARRGATSRQVVATGLAGAGALMIVVALIWPGDWNTRSVLIGAASGLGACTALSLITWAFSVAPMGVGSPANAVVSSSIPVMWDVINGRPLGGWAIVGVSIGIMAVLMTSYAPGGEGRTILGLLLGAASGLAIGSAFVVMSYADRDSGVWPVAAQRTTGFAVLALLALARRETVFAPIGPKLWLGPRLISILSAQCAAIGVVALLAGYRTGQLAPTGIASSQSAAVGVVLAAMFDQQRLRWWQTIGLTFAALGVALMAV